MEKRSMTQKCPRCGTWMNWTGCSKRGYWKCPKCGKVLGGMILGVGMSA